MIYGASLVLLRDDRSRFISLLVGVSVGSACLALLSSYGTLRWNLQDAVKYGAGVPVLFLVLALLVRRGVKQVWIHGLLFTVALAALFLNFRSLALVAVGSVLVLVARGRVGRHSFARFAGSVVLALVCYTLLTQMIERGIFGDVLARRHAAQAALGPSALLGGRTEFPLSIAVISAKPLLGWGDLGSVPGSIIGRASTLADSLGYASPEAYMQYWFTPAGGISLHSMVFESWASQGILGVAVPVFVFFAAGNILLRWPASDAMLPIAIVMALQVVWDLLFSPWQAGTAVFSGMLLALWALRPMADRDILLHGRGSEGWPRKTPRGISALSVQ